MKPASPQDEINKLFATAVELHRQGHLPQAESLYRAIVAVDSRHADALHLLGVSEHQQGRHADAADSIDKAIGLNRRVPQYHFNRGVALQALQQHAAAAECYRRAVRLKPDYAAAWENLGVALQDNGDFDSARAAYGKALALDNSSVLAHQNLGTLLLNLGSVREAREHFRTVLGAHPAHAEAHSKYAAALLADGLYRDGWTEHEWRHHSPSFTEHNASRVVPFPKWDGGSLAGRTLLINPEQGIGEEIMYASCFADVMAQAGHCVIECDPRLARPFARSFPGATIVECASRYADFAWTASLPDVDCRISAASLPRFFRNSAEEFPADAGYLKVAADQCAAWRRTVAALGKPLSIGISWRGGRELRSINARSIALSEWQPIFAAVDASFVNLQYGDHAAEIEAFHSAGLGKLHTLEGIDPLRDLDGFMALIAALDLVISIDNSTVFAAGAVGTPVWVLLPSSAEWRWRGTGDRSPWYPQAVLHRQEQPGVDAWRSLLRHVARQLPGIQPRNQEKLSSTVLPEASSEPAGARAAASRLPEQRAQPHDRGRALLVNDTRSWYHWGCSCTSLALHVELRRRWSRVDSLPIQRLIGLADLPLTAEHFDDDEQFARFSAAHPEILARLREADAVYINGEGTLHGMGEQPLGLLYLAYVAKHRLRRTVHLINHSCYPEEAAVLGEGPAYDLYRKVYRDLDYVAVREPVSTRLLSEMGIPAQQSFDCLPLFVRYQGLLARKESRARSTTVVIAGSVAWAGSQVVPLIGDFIRRLHAAGLQPLVLIGADAHLAADDVSFVSILQQVARGHFQLLNATSELEWLRTIADAGLLVSGRFHHSIAAAFLDTPFIVMESNTPKIAGLMQALESDSFLSITQPGLPDALLERTRAMLAEPERFQVRNEVKERLLSLAERNFAENG